MDISGWKRNAKAIHGSIEVKGDQMIATKALRAFIPERWLQGNLGSFGEDVSFLSMFCLVDANDNYAVWSTPNRISSAPSSTNVVTIDDVSYSEFRYEPGDVIVKNLNMVKLPTLTYWIYNEFVMLGKVPFYFDYEETCKLLDLAKEYAAADLRVDVAILNMIVSSIARDPKDLFSYWRNVKDQSKSPKYIGLKNVAYSVPNTFSKLLGAYSGPLRFANN